MGEPWPQWVTATTAPARELLDQPRQGAAGSHPALSFAMADFLPLALI